MKMYKYDGRKSLPCEEFSEISEFIKFYDNAYYLSPEKSLIPRLRRTKKETGDKIDRILANGVKSKEDIMEILCWKTGGKRIDKNTIKNPRTESCIKIDDKFVKWFTASATQDHMVTDNDAIDALKKIMEIPGIGFTYAITLLYFMSKGQYPIYDKFAHIALIMIDSDNPFDHIIKDSELLEIPHTINKNEIYHVNQRPF